LERPLYPNMAAAFEELMNNLDEVNRDIPAVRSILDAYLGNKLDKGEPPSPDAVVAMELRHLGDKLRESIIAYDDIYAHLRMKSRLTGARGRL